MVHVLFDINTCKKKIVNSVVFWYCRTSTFPIFVLCWGGGGGGGHLRRVKVPRNQMTLKLKSHCLGLPRCESRISESVKRGQTFDKWSKSERDPGRDIAAGRAAADLLLFPNEDRGRWELLALCLSKCDSFHRNTLYHDQTTLDRLYFASLVLYSAVVIWSQ